jgi:hypothetical protein
MNKEEITRPAQEQAPKMSATPETLSPEKFQESATSKESALTDLAMRSANETKGIESGFAQSAHDLGGTPEDIEPITAQLETLEGEKEKVIESARGEIQAEAVIEDSRRNARYPEEMLDTEANKTIAPPPLEQTIDPANVLRERNIKNPDELTGRQYSRENMSEDRSRLAAEIKQERVEAREKLAMHRTQVEQLSKKVEESDQEIESAMQDLEYLEQERSARANSLAGRFRNFLHIETTKDKEIDANSAEKNSFIESSTAEKQEAERELEESMNMLIDSDAAFASIKEKLAEHYAGALEKEQTNVEQTMLRNKAFFVHTILENSHQHHNINSNVSEKASFEDDLDIFLSLEPSVSASSLVSGENEKGLVSGIWGGADSPSGLLIGGGSIGAYSEEDAETVSLGIKKRAQKEVPEYNQEYVSKAQSFENRDENWIADMDKVTKRQVGGSVIDDKSYNEFVIDNPEAIGYFKGGEQDEKGAFWINNLDTKDKLAELHKQYNYDPTSSVYSGMHEEFSSKIKEYKDRFDMIKAKGLPFYVMTPDRRFHEVKNVNENGSLEIGEELTPEQAATGRAGLSPEKRKEIGTKLLHKEVFRGEETHKEAQDIVSSL